MKVDINVDEKRCKGCGICIEICQAGVLEKSERTDVKGRFHPVVKNFDACMNCGMCEMLCPDFAIWVTAREEQRV